MKLSVALGALALAMAFGAVPVSFGAEALEDDSVTFNGTHRAHRASTLRFLPPAPDRPRPSRCSVTRTLPSAPGSSRP